MQCVDCRVNVMGSVPSSFFATGRCLECNKKYEMKMEAIEEKKKRKEEIEKEIEEKRKEEEGPEKEMGRFDMMDFD